MTPVATAKFPDDDRLAALVRERYRNSQHIGADWSETIETLLSHRSVRDYLPKAVPDDILHLAIAAAQSAPSSSNLQAWSVIAVRDEVRKAKLNAVAGTQRQITQAPLLLIWLADLSRPRRIAADQGSAADGLDYVESFLLGVIDAALAAQNAVVSLESQGLGTCYIGAIRNDPETVARELELPEGVFPVFGLTVGYPDPAAPAAVKPRLPQTTVLHHEHYDRSRRSDDLRHYNTILQDFQAEQRMPRIDWTAQVKNRIGTVEALKGRHLLGVAARRLGFRLK
ncbi:MULTISPECIES: NADPH-dependent oxidoreductase [Rhizobium]|jgi:nitroreductase|uniref:Nitroreductase n=1 Tax=Rhizobium miluonense TaxID=411945 RepID=A0ABU1SXD8_9HYPH|nr:MULTISPECIES: NADPH-dependent oxidoreductase [Rhizobium]MBB3428960.1 nitroreductase [Rhizobium sp. BK312]MDR6903580.1 nitroreductase [Rhizobium miluonense]